MRHFPTMLSRVAPLEAEPEKVEPLGGGCDPRLLLGQDGRPLIGLKLLEPLDERLPGHYRLDAVRGHLYEMLGDHQAAAAHYRAAARRTTNLPERHYLTRQSARLNAD